MVRFFFHQSELNQKEKENVKLQLLLKNRDKDLEESILKYESVKLKVLNIMKYQLLPRRWPLLRSTRSFSSRMFGIFSAPTHLKKN